MVKGRSLDTLFDQLELETVDVLKIDIEGAEEAVLGASRRLPDVRTIVGELHDARTGGAIASLLAEHFEVRIGGSPPTFTATRRIARE